MSAVLYGEWKGGEHAHCITYSKQYKSYTQHSLTSDACVRCGVGQAWAEASRGGPDKSRQNRTGHATPCTDM